MSLIARRRRASLAARTFTAAAGVIMGVLAPASRSIAQPLFTVTEQTRTVTAVVGPESVSQAAPNAETWSTSISVGPPEGPNASASHTSTITPTTLSGNTRAVTFGSASTLSASASGVITFTTTEVLHYRFRAFNNSFFTALQGGTINLDSEFGFALNGFTPFASAVGFLNPGTYTLRYETSDAFGSREHKAMSYTLTLAPVVPPAIVAGPILRTSDCHRFYQLATSTWPDAEGRARQMGGHLVTVNNAAEQTYLQNTFGSVGPTRKWIGMRAPIMNGPFSWVSNQTSTYTNWFPGRPEFDPFFPSPHFVLYAADGRWDQSDAANAGGIVELEGCRCDWNADTRRTSEDFFAFLNDFFTATADFNCSGSTTSTDFFEFLTCLNADVCP